MERADDGLTAATPVEVEDGSAEIESRPGRTRLSDEVKTFIVTRYALYDSTAMIRDAVKEEFGLEMSIQQVYDWNPERSGTKPGMRWMQHFEVVRKKFIEDVSSIPIAQKAVRLRRLDRMALRAERSGALVVAAQLHEQAAKEMGEVYTNKRQVSGTMTLEQTLAQLEAGG